MNTIDNSTSRISDNELILYFYRDGLTPERMAEIDNALFAQPELRQRYTELQRMLHEIDCAPAFEPDAVFTQRVWQGLASRIDAEPLPSRTRRSWLAEWIARLAPARIIVTVFTLAFAVAIGFYAGRHGTGGVPRNQQAI